MGKRKVYVNGAFVAECRNRLSMTQQDLADATKAWKLRVISNLERLHLATPQVIDDVATALNRTFEELTQTPLHRPEASRTATAAQQTRVTFSLNITGVVGSVGQLAQLAIVNPEVARLLVGFGIAIEAIDSQVKVEPITIQDLRYLVLLRGPNSNARVIYCYLLISTQKLSALEEKLKSPGYFNPLDYGEGIASGYGEPTTEVIEELVRSYGVEMVSMASRHSAKTNLKAPDGRKRRRSRPLPS